MEVVSDLLCFRTMPFVSNVDKVSGDEATFGYFPMLFVFNVTVDSVHDCVTLICEPFPLGDLITLWSGGGS